MPGPSGLNPMASPFKLDSPTGDSKSQVFYKEDDFRPSATAHSQDNDSDDSLPRTFLPPDSPDTSSTGGIDLSEDLKGPHVCLNQSHELIEANVFFVEHGLYG